MADWVDSYVFTPLGSGELDRLFKEYDDGRISRSYLLGLFRMTEEVFDGVVSGRKSVQRNEGKGPESAGRADNGVRERTHRTGSS